MLLEGGTAGGNTVPNTLDGQDANLGVTPGQLVLVSGAGGAGWPGGSAVGNGFGGGTPTEAFVAGGGGGLPFVGGDLINPGTGGKDASAGRDGSATITFFAPAELAETGGNDALALGVTAAMLLLAGSLVMAATRRRGTA